MSMACTWMLQVVDDDDNDPRHDQYHLMIFSFFVQDPLISREVLNGGLGTEISHGVCVCACVCARARVCVCVCVCV